MHWARIIFGYRITRPETFIWHTDYFFQVCWRYLLLASLVCFDWRWAEHVQVAVSNDIGLLPSLAWLLVTTQPNPGPHIINRMHVWLLCNWLWSGTYDYIRSLSNSSTIPSTVFLNTASATSDSEKADLFNTFFHSVYKPSLSNSSLLPSSLLPSSEPTLTYPNITNISFTELDVFSTLSSLDPANQ